MNIDDVIAKIKNCVRLANRTTETGERETALRLARNLADKNGIAFDDIEVGETAETKAVIQADDEYHNWSGCEMGYAYYILDRHFGTVVMISRQRNNSAKKRLSWIGSPLNIAIAQHVLHVLLRECRRAFREERAKPLKMADDLREVMAEWGSTPVAIKNAVATVKRKMLNRDAFMRGFFYAIDQKLTAHPLRNDVEADRAAARRKLDEYRQSHTVKDQKARSTKNINAETFAAGLRSGCGVNLARPCEDCSDSPLALTA